MDKTLADILTYLFTLEQANASLRTEYEKLAVHHAELEKSIEKSATKKNSKGSE